MTRIFGIGFFLLLGACAATYPHGIAPKDSSGASAIWCPAYVVTDYGQTPPKKIEVNPAGWCWRGDSIAGYNVQ